MPAPERNCFPKSGKLTPNHDKNTLKLAYLWSSSDLHWHDITSMPLPAGFRNFFFALLELGVKNERRENDVDMNVQC